MSDTVVRIVTAALAGLWLWAALAKALRWAAWRKALAGYGLSAGLERFAAGATPIAELGVAAALLSPTPRAGAALSVALLAAFSLLVVRGRLLQGEKLPCGCFGGARERDYRSMLARNGLLGFMSAVVLVARHDGAPFDGISLPGASEVLPALLIALGVIVAAWMAYQFASARRGWRS
jgi:hypothetical protein